METCTLDCQQHLVQNMTPSPMFSELWKCAKVSPRHNVNKLRGSTRCNSDNLAGVTSEFTLRGLLILVGLDIEVVYTSARWVIALLWNSCLSGNARASPGAIYRSCRLLRIVMKFTHKRPQRPWRCTWEPLPGLLPLTDTLVSGLGLWVFGVGPGVFGVGPGVFGIGPGAFVRGHEVFDVGLGVFDIGPGVFRVGPGVFWVWTVAYSSNMDFCFGLGTDFVVSTLNGSWMVLML